MHVPSLFNRGTCPPSKPLSVPSSHPTSDCSRKRRRELTRQAAKIAEDAKVAVRNVRRDANEKNKKLKKDGELTEDELKRLDKDVQDLTDRYIKKIEEIAAAKEKEIMEI